MTEKLIGDVLTYDEALRFMGLDDEATDQDVKVAYREMAQILHPDRFSGNEKLQDRATEQFKALNEAKDILTSTNPSKSGPRSSRTSRQATATPRYDTREAQLNARINGIQTAREGLVAYRDAEEESRRNGLIMVALGVVGVLIGRRIVWIDGIAGALAVWGIIKTVNSHMMLRTLDAKLDELAKQRKAAIHELEELQEDHD